MVAFDWQHVFLLVFYGHKPLVVGPVAAVTGCLQLLEILEISLNLMALLEIFM